MLLSNEDGMKELDINYYCGVYFLVSAGHVVYVGQSLNVIMRITTHVKEDKKKFDSTFYIRCDKSDLDEIEKKYILKYDPKYNFTFKMDRLAIKIFDNIDMSKLYTHEKEYIYNDEISFRDKANYLLFCNSNRKKNYIWKDSDADEVKEIMKFSRRFYGEKH